MFHHPKASKESYSPMDYVQCSHDYTEKYHLGYTENKAHSLGVRNTVGVLSHKLSKPLYMNVINGLDSLWLSTPTVFLTPNECALFSV